ncbi:MULTISPECIES: hypothetical protein [Providencia]|nr:MULTISPECIES: hypothetical protein [Providencia]APC11791.1 hypothetical protein RB151_021190 [Providencia rettgeri]MDK3006703.1 hypothetical protein [Providencia rettgeri]MDO7830203.1 hypothetical protein [Providencia sp. CRE-138-0026]MDR9613507.1 hypothetical protein [Providencia rettgeri]UYV39971.1 hypothetical protein NTP67_12015 [Providencia rettgeri]
MGISLLTAALSILINASLLPALGVFIEKFCQYAEMMLYTF